VADQGRLTKGAAQAFLGRVLVTYASPQFNSPITSLPATATTVLATTDQTRWQQAYDVNTAAIATLTANGFGLYSKWDYTMWTTEGATNPEAVMVTQFNTDQTDQRSQPQTAIPGLRCLRAIASSGGSNQPTWDLVSRIPNG
jgi:hypothetical protein